MAPKLSRGGMQHRAAIAPPPSLPHLYVTERAKAGPVQVSQSLSDTSGAKKAFVPTSIAKGTYDQDFTPEQSAAAIAAVNAKTQAKKSEAAQVAALQAQYKAEGSPPEPAAGYPSQQDAPPEASQYEEQTQEVPEYRQQAEARPEREQVSDWENDIPWQQEQGFAGEGPLKAISYVKDGHLCTVGVCETASGLVPIVDKRRAPRGTRNGPVNIGSEGYAMSLFGKAQMEAQKDAAGSLVRRARSGDQNAMALLKHIGENAKQGNGKARYALKAVKEYIDQNPPKQEGEFFGTEPDKQDSLMTVCVMLANGPPLSPQLVERFASSFGSEDAGKLFIYGVVNCNHEGLNALISKLGSAGKVADFGRKVGKARALQIARTPTGPIAPFSSDAAWEMGE